MHHLIDAMDTTGVFVAACRVSRAMHLGVLLRVSQGNAEVTQRIVSG